MKPFTEDFAQHSNEFLLQEFKKLHYCTYARPIILGEKINPQEKQWLWEIEKELLSRGIWPPREPITG